MIIHASIRTDIPAFYSEWFTNRIREGYVRVRNPYNPLQVTEYSLDPEVVDLIIFCSKNPSPMLKYMDLLKSYRTYWYITITPYEADIEPGLFNTIVSKRKIIEAFQQISEIVGEEHIGWRYDPIFIDDKYTVKYHLKRFEGISAALQGYTKNCVISFLDLYQKVKRNFPEAKMVSKEQRKYLGEHMAHIATEHKMTLRPCGEGTELAAFGADCNGCMTQQIYENAILYSVNTHTGQLIDKRTDMIGDIRSTIVYNNGYVYFTTKGGYLYRVAMNADGTFGAVASYNLGGAATSTPVVYKGRIYVGVCGNGGQYNADGGHHFDVLTESASGLSLAYKVSIPGYPQAAPLLSTAYENQDFNGDGKADGRVYLYFTYNAKPGGIYMLTDEPGQTSGKPEELFRPVLAQQEYCISPICVDRDGTLYYKNDSCYLMALETNGAYLDSVSAEADTGRVSWEKAFQRSEKEHTLRVAENATKVTLTFKAPAGCTLTVNGKASNGTYVADVRSGQADVTVKTTLNGKSRDYIFHLTSGLGNSSLANLVVSTSNTFTDTSKYLTLSPVFDSTKTSYTVSYLADKEENKEKFLRLYVEPSDGDATVTVQKVKGVEKVSMPVVANGKTKRVNVYWETDASEAQVKITVTAAGSGKTDYLLTIQRKEIVPTPTPTEVPEVFGPWKTISAATVFSPAVQMRTSNKGRKEKRTVGKKLTPTIKVTATSIKLKVKQSTSKIKVSGLAKGDSVKSWTSSNKKIVSVNSKGTMKGLKAGKAKVTITLASGKKQVISITVQKTTVRTTKITGLKSSVTVARNKKLALKPVISPITSQEKVTYSSSNKKIATVSSSGVITGKKKGTAYITVKSGKIRKKVKVVVK